MFNPSFAVTHQFNVEALNMSIRGMDKTSRHALWKSVESSGTVFPELLRNTPPPSPSSSSSSFSSSPSPSPLSNSQPLPKRRRLRKSSCNGQFSEAGIPSPTFTDLEGSENVSGIGGPTLERDEPSCFSSTSEVTLPSLVLPTPSKALAFVTNTIPGIKPTASTSQKRKRSEVSDENSNSASTSVEPKSRVSRPPKRKRDENCDEDTDFAGLKGRVICPIKEEEGTTWVEVNSLNEEIKKVQDHIRRVDHHNKSRLKEYVCIECGKVMARVHDIRKHVLLHFEATYFCTNERGECGCGTGFTRVDALIRHIKTKTAAKKRASRNKGTKNRNV